jgi:hypothetical protein
MTVIWPSCAHLENGWHRSLVWFPWSYLIATGRRRDYQTYPADSSVVCAPLRPPAQQPALAIFALPFSGNDLFSALFYLPSHIESITVTVGLALFQTQFDGQSTLMMAASLTSVAPVIIAFFLPGVTSAKAPP